MITTASSRVTAAIAGVLVAVGILAGGAATVNRTQILADYGAAITAEDASNAARDKGVPHMSDRHRGSGNFFERMNGGDN